VNCSPAVQAAAQCFIASFLPRRVPPASDVPTDPCPTNRSIAVGRQYHLPVHVIVLCKGKLFNNTEISCCCAVFEPADAIVFLSQPRRLLYDRSGSICVIQGSRSSIQGKGRLRCPCSAASSRIKIRLGSSQVWRYPLDLLSQHGPTHGNAQKSAWWKLLSSFIPSLKCSRPKVGATLQLGVLISIFDCETAS
jgi:hypothetical protein